MPTTYLILHFYSILQLYVFFKTIFDESGLRWRPWTRIYEKKESNILVIINN